MNNLASGNLKNWLSNIGLGWLFGLADGGIATGPTPALIGEGGEPEVVAPLSQLPSLFNSIMGSPMGMAGAGGDITIEINGPVVRSDLDIQKLAKEVKRELETTLERQRRMRGG